MAIQLKPISKEYLISSLKGFEKYILNKKYQEKGIQPDWSESDPDSASFIKNKPSSLSASDVHDWAKEENKPSYSKEEIGLGNVPNVSTNDQTPTYTESSTLEELQSGETLSDAFSKISKSITDLIAHITNLNNPHKVSKSQLDLENVDNTSDENKPVSTAQQEELDKKIDKTTVATNSTLGLIKSGEDIDVDNNGNVSVKDNSHNHKVENISDLSVSASELNVLDGITASTEELNHLTGVTDNVQTQLDGKAPSIHTHDDRYYTEEEIDAKLTENSTSQQASANSAVSNHNTSSSAHSDIRDLISDLTTRLNALADSDDITLDQLSEIVAYIKNNKLKLPIPVQGIMPL